MEVCVEEDEIDVTLQILEALQEQRLALLLRLSAFNLKNQHKNIYECTGGKKTGLKPVSSILVDLVNVKYIQFETFKSFRSDVTQLLHK